MGNRCTSSNKRLNGSHTTKNDSKRNEHYVKYSKNDI